MCSYFRTTQIYVDKEQKGKEWGFILGLTLQINHSVRKLLKLLKKEKKETFFSTVEMSSFFAKSVLCGPAFDTCVSSLVGWSGQSKPSVKRQPSASRGDQVLAQRPESSGNFYARWECTAVMSVLLWTFYWLCTRVRQTVWHCKDYFPLQTCIKFSLYMQHTKLCSTLLLKVACGGERPLLSASGATVTVKWSPSFVTSRTLLLEWLPRACVQTGLGHPVVHWHHYTPRPLQSKHGRYEWPGRL